jgi:hypothetical protein
MITKEQLKDKIINNEDISGIDYSHITDMSQMFRLKTISFANKIKDKKIRAMIKLYKE